MSDAEPEVAFQARLSSPPPPISPSVATSTNTTIAHSDLFTKNGEEWSSPAFIKRARTSYGSLFDADYDPFAEEDGTIRGKGRKRTRLSSTWRYSSRSPTPEIAEPERESSIPTSPEAVLQPKPMMLDEGSQTVGLEAGDAAEALANFSRQSTNVGSSSYPKVNGSMFSESHTQLREEDHPISHENIMPSRTVQIEIERDAMTDAGPEAPPSPLLQPLASDPLPAISPLTSTRLGSPELDSQNGIAEQIQSFVDQLAAPIEPSQNSVPDEEHEDLYNASPAGHRDEQHVEAFHGFQHPVIDVNGTTHLPPDEHFATEDQYGHWQSAAAQLSHFGSPYRVAEEEQDHFYVEGGHNEGHYSHDGVSISHAHAHRMPEYPDLDEIPSQHGTAGWGSASSTVKYPDLPDASNGLENGSIVHRSPAEAPAMSRSQSTQSAVVDLTESSDDEEEGDPMKEVADEEVDEGPEEDAEEEPQEVVRRRYFTNARRDDVVYTEEDVSQDSRSEEEFSEDEFEEADQDQMRPPGFYPMQTEDFEDEEDRQSYEEEVEDNGPQARPPVQQQPVFIDLLSSDDEGDRKEPQSRQSRQSPPSQTSKPTQQTEASESDMSDEYEDEDEDMENANNVPYAERSELRTVAPRTFPKEAPVEEEYEEIEDDEGEFEDEDDNISMRQQREASEGVESVSSSVAEEEHLETEQLAVGEMEENDDNLAATVRSETSEQDEEQTADEIDQSLLLTSDKVPQQHSKKQSAQEKSSLFTRVFNLDGASDEPRVSYPSLPKEESAIEGTPTSAIEKTSQISKETPKQANDQLPTPDATQISEKLLSADVSFSSTKHIPADNLQDDLLGASATMIQTKSSPEAISVEDGAEVVKPNTIPVAGGETEQTVFDKDVRLKAVEDGSMSDLTLPIKMALDIAGPETESITEDTAKITIGENDGKAAQKPTNAQLIEDATTEAEPEVQDGDAERALQGSTEPSHEIKVPSPRRSHRRGRSAASNVEVQEPARPVTPAKSRGQVEIGSARTDRSTPLIIDRQATPNGHDASIELAVSALDSPSKPLHDLRKPPVVDVKLRLSRALRTELREFTALKVLRYHLTQKLDVLAVATTTPSEPPQRAKGGPRHYSITFNITDPSTAPAGVTQVQVFRPYKEALPIVKAGDGILLRNFEVIAVKNKGFGLKSDDPSSWAVFKDNEEIEMRGPPVEFQGGEEKYVADLKAWYGSLDSTALAKLDRANAAKEPATGVGGKGIGKAFQ